MQKGPVSLESLLINAQQKGSLEVLALLNERNDPIDFNEALIWASQEGYTQTVQYLLDKKADVNYTNWFGESALLLAAKNGHTEVVKLLTNHHANVNHNTNDEDTALILAAANGNCDIVELLIIKGADVNHKNLKGDTALTLAANHGHAKTVNLLLRHGANADHKTNVFGDTALTLSIYGSYAVIAELIKAPGQLEVLKNRFPNILVELKNYLTTEISTAFDLFDLGYSSELILQCLDNYLLENNNDNSLKDEIRQLLAIREYLSVNSLPQEIVGIIMSQPVFTLSNIFQDEKGKQPNTYVNHFQLFSKCAKQDQDLRFLAVEQNDSCSTNDAESVSESQTPSNKHKRKHKLSGWTSQPLRSIRNRYRGN